MFPPVPEKTKIHRVYIEYSKTDRDDFYGINISDVHNKLVEHYKFSIKERGFIPVDSEKDLDIKNIRFDIEFCSGDEQVDFYIQYEVINEKYEEEMERYNNYMKQAKRPAS